MAASSGKENIQIDDAEHSFLPFLEDTEFENCEIAEFEITTTTEPDDFHTVIVAVINEILSDPILPEEVKKSLKDTHVASLSVALQPLLNICKSEIFTPSARERSWGKFQASRMGIERAVEEVLNCKHMSAIVSFATAEKIINGTLPSYETSSVNFSVTDISKSEVDILTYVGGFILFRCKKHFKHDANILQTLAKLTSDDHASKLISLKTRGGLTEPSPDIVPFFLMLEAQFRNFKPSNGPLSVHVYTENISLNQEITNIFYDCTYDSESDVKSQEKMLLYIVSLYFHVRCNAKCRQTLERFLRKSEVSKKQKSLRKDIQN